MGEVGKATWEESRGEGQVRAPTLALPSAPGASEFPAYPKSWYYLASSKAIRSDRPFARELFGRRLVAFRNTRGDLSVMESRCSHLGADLSLGRIVKDTIQCPFHHWCFSAQGRCTHIPATAVIPDWARQICYPVVERQGMVFIFNGEQPTFELPFFPNRAPEEFTPAPAFATTLRCPWYLIGANAFDMQHFRAAHDRRMVGEPIVECPAPFALRATGTFDVCSDSLQDRLTRLLAGNRVTMSITDWCGNLLFATAKFRRTCSYGMVAIEPLANGQATVRVFVFVPRSRSQLGRWALDRLHGRIRRLFIKGFLSEDARRLDGTPYQPQGLIAEDRHLAEYFTWVARASRGLSPIEGAIAGEVSLTSQRSDALTPQLLEQT